MHIKKIVDIFFDVESKSKNLFWWPVLVFKLLDFEVPINFRENRTAHIFHRFFLVNPALALWGVPTPKPPWIAIISLIYEFKRRVIALRVPLTRDTIFPNIKSMGTLKSIILKTQGNRQKRFSDLYSTSKNTLFFLAVRGGNIKTQ